MELFSYELSSQLFFLVPANGSGLYEKPEEWFGRVSIEKFPAVGSDVREACRCLALDQGTASVFHAMRILEHCLRELAENLGVPSDQDNWKNVIDQIEKRVRAMEYEPRSAQKSELVQFYSEGCAEFRYFKDAWRNHVSHSRTSYDVYGAERVLTHVRDFTRHLATRLGTETASSDDERQDVPAASDIKSSP